MLLLVCLTWRSKVSDRHVPSSWLMLALLGWLPLTLAWSLSPGYAQTQLAVFLCLPLAWWTGSQLQLERRLQPLLGWMLPVLLAALVVWGVIQGPGTYTAKPQGPFNDPNTYAAVLNLLMLPLLAHWLNADLKDRSALQRTSGLALLGGGLFVSFLISSRGAGLALFLTAPVLFWKSRSAPDSRRKWGLLALTLLIAFVAAWITTGGLNVVTRLADTVKAGDQPRWLLLRTTWSMILDHPWLGTGLGSFRLLYPRYRLPGETVSAGGWVHNDFLQLWAEAGLPMFLMLLGLAAWVIWQGVRALRDRTPDALERLGYLAAILAVLLHATVNFLLYFAPVVLLLGLYLARSEAAPRAVRQGGLGGMVTRVYGLLLGLLCLYLLTSELLLGQAAAIQRQLWKWHLAYPRFEVAHRLSQLNPYDPTPQQTMGQELAARIPLASNPDDMRRAALRHMDSAQRLIPCYLPYTDEALALLDRCKPDADEIAQAWRMLDRGLQCSPRHGLFFWSAGLLAGQKSGGEALPWWRAGLQASVGLGDRLLLASAILAREFPGHGEELSRLSRQIADNMRSMESNSGRQADQAFWTGAQNRLQRLCGERYLELIRP